MSDGQKEALAIQALGLLNEQVQARIVHYKGELETSPELDAITAQVVAQLKAMQAAVAGDVGSQKTAEEMEEQLTKTLGTLLPRFFSAQTNFAARILKPIGKRIAKLFFESELHEKSKGDKDKVIFHAEQGVTTRLAAVALPRSGAAAAVVLGEDRRGAAGGPVASNSGRCVWVQSSADRADAGTSAATGRPARAIARTRRPTSR